MSDLIDIVVRFHDTRRLPELTRAIFSVTGQTYRPLRIILAVQRFSAADIALTKAALAPILAGEDGIDLAVVGFDEPQPKDARSVLLNIGVAQTQGKYLAFLDYDDILYPEAYEMLIRQLKATQAAIAFASVRIMRLQVYSQFFYAEQTVPPFWGTNLLNLFHSNFCPLHSYVIDRSQVHPDLLSYNPALTNEEDYDVLLRICARYPSDFSLVGTQIGDYYYKLDGSNTIPQDGTPATQAMLDAYEDVRATIEHRRRNTLISAAVRKELRKSFGLKSAPSVMTIRDVIDMYS